MSRQHTYFLPIFLLVFIFSVVVYPFSAIGADNYSKIRPVPSSLLHETKPTPDLTGKETLSLEEALDLAYKYNPDLRKVELQLDRAEILRDIAAQSVTLLPTGELLVAPEGRSVINNYEQADVNWKAIKKVSESEKQRIEKEVVTAYADAVKSYNQIELTRWQLQDMEEQNRLSQIASVQGVMANSDLRSSLRGVEQLEEALKASQAAHELALSSLRTLLNQEPDWIPILTSRPVADSFSRPGVWLALSRAENQSIMMVQAESALEIEESKLYWGLGSGEDDPYMDKINLHLKKLGVEEARRDTRGTVEQLYHRIDILEKQITRFQTVIKQKEQDLQVVRLKHEVGIIPYRSLIPGQPCLVSAELAFESSNRELDNLKADLVIARANFSYLIGEQVYSKLDWITMPTAE